MEQKNPLYKGEDVPPAERSKLLINISIGLIVCIVGLVFILIGRNYSKPTNLPKPLTVEEVRELMQIRR